MRARMFLKTQLVFMGSLLLGLPSAYGMERDDDKQNLTILSKNSTLSLQKDRPYITWEGLLSCQTLKEVTEALDNHVNFLKKKMENNFSKLNGAEYNLWLKRWNTFYDLLQQNGIFLPIPNDTENPLGLFLDEIDIAAFKEKAIFTEISKHRSSFNGPPNSSSSKSSHQSSSYSHSPQYYFEDRNDDDFVMGKPPSDLSLSRSASLHHSPSFNAEDEGFDFDFLLKPKSQTYSSSSSSSSTKTGRRSPPPSFVCGETPSQQNVVDISDWEKEIYGHSLNKSSTPLTGTPIVLTKSPLSLSPPSSDDEGIPPLAIDEDSCLSNKKENTDPRINFKSEKE